jgi:Flp pilus assembly protein TadD
VNRQFVDKDLAGALEEYRTIREVYPDFMPAWNNSGRILMGLGRIDEAVLMFEKAAAAAPHNSIPLQNLWFCHDIYRKDIKAAEAVARRFADMAPDFAQAHSLLGFTLAVQEKFPEAERALKRAIEIEPQHPYALPNLAHMLLAAGRAAEAVPIYRKVSELGSEGGMGGDPEVNLLDLATALNAAGDREEAARVAAEAEALTLKNRGPGRPDAQNFYCTLGQLCLLQGKRTEARAYLDKVLALKAEDPGSLTDLAGLYACFGETGLAITTLTKALEKGSGDPFFPVIMPDFLPIRKDPAFRALFKLPN